MRKLIIGLSILFSLVLLSCVGVNSVVPFLIHANERQRAKLIARADIDNLEKMLSQYEMMVGNYPPTLPALCIQPNNMVDPSKWVDIWQDRYTVNPALKLDPWKRPYEYIVKGNEYEIRSFGPDGRRGTFDDFIGTNP